MRPMYVCPTCGNKRCPKATNHLRACTGSNEPGQPGSIYRVKPGSVIAWWLEGDGRAVAAAARRVADAPEWLQRLLEDPPPEPDAIEWCDFHEAGGAPGRDCWGAGLDGQDTCEMVRRPLLKPDDAAST